MFDVGNFFHFDSIGDSSEIYLDSKNKINKEWLKDRPQNYIGEVLYKNIHRHGFYFVENGEKLFYDGLFYSNKLDGYAQVFYDDGSHFQGLFKDNVRFGPGVLTYQDGRQDVGLWSSYQLVRLGGLNVDISLPRLANTPMGLLKLLKFRYLVPVCPKREDKAYNVLKKIGANEEVLKKSKLLYNSEVDHRKNIFFNKNHYDSEFYDNQDCYIDIIVSDDEDEDEDTNEDDEKDREAEESPSKNLDVNMQRVRQISEGLEMLEIKLSPIQKERAMLERKVEYCRTCCRDQDVHGEDEEDQGIQLEPETHNVIPDIERHMPQPANLSKTKIPEDLRSFQMSMRSSSTLAELLDLSVKSGISVVSKTNGYADPASDTDVDLEISVLHPNKQVQDYLEGCHCDGEIQIEDLHELEAQLDKLVRDEVFFNSIRENLTVKLHEHLRKCHEENEVKTKKLLVNEVISWNNERYCMRMLQHSFLHRRSEYMVNFKVSEIVGGNRHTFEEPGEHERHCLKFLNACASGDKAVIFDLINGNHVNLNVCDANGNTGMFYAAVNCHADIIKVLVNLGAKLDQENDEGLLPLNMCLLIYLAHKLKVDNWEKAFLPEERLVQKVEETCQWYPNASLLSILSSSRKVQKSKSTISGKSVYVFDTNFVTELQDEDVGSKHRGHPEAEQHIEKSIISLLRFGSNPNSCAVPLPALFLSVFTENWNLVDQILEANADVNATIENDMTALHVVASLKCTQENVTICHTLLCYSPDASLRTSTNHWLEQKDFILGKGINPDDVVDLGKNALHLLCIRKDFASDKCSYFPKIATNLADSNLDFGKKYLGHTPLSLAVLVGNTDLVKTLSKFPFIDPYQLLDNDMGNVLTVYVLKRYEDRLPVNAKEILKYLVDAGVNPLKHVDQFENAIAFMDNEQEAHKGKKGQNQHKEKGERKEKNEGNSKQSKLATLKNNKEKVGNQKALINYMRELGRETIIKYIQMQAVENLYNFIEENITEHNCITMLAQFLTPSIAISNLQRLFKHGRIHSERFDKSVCLKLIDIAQTHQIIKPKKGQNKEVKGPKSSKTSNETEALQKVDYKIILDLTDFNKLHCKVKQKYLPPGLDHLSNYKVCYECLKKRNKELMVCPRCQYVYFCSAACNKANLKLQTLHTCNILFYPSEKENTEQKPLEEQDNLADMFSRIKQSCEERLRKKLEEAIELERKQFEEEMKLDIYGTKGFKRRKLGLWRTPTTTTLYGSAMEYSRADVTELTKRTTYDSLGDEQFKKDQIKDIERLRSSSTAARRFVSVEEPKRQGHEKHLKSKEGCECLDCVGHKNRAVKAKCKADAMAVNKEVVKRTAETFTNTKKLRTVPRKYQEFVELLAKYFPDTDFSSLFLPYTCYANGHLYYKFLEKDIYTKTYSMM